MSTNHTNGADKVVRVLRVFASGRVVPNPGRPPKDWGAIMGRARAHALPADGPTSPMHEAAAKVKNPAKVAAGKARAAKAAAAKLEAAKAAAAKLEAAKKAAKPAPKKAPAKAPSKAKAKPAAKAKAPAKKAHGGARAGAGAKPKNGDTMQVWAGRITAAQRKKLDKLGGVEWLRDKIDRAAVPAKRAA